MLFRSTLNRHRRAQPSTSDLWDLKLRWCVLTGQPQPSWVDLPTWQDWQECPSFERARTRVQPRVEIEPGREIAPQPRGRRAREIEQCVMLAGVTVLEEQAPREWIARLEDCAEHEYKLLPALYETCGQVGDLAVPDFLAVSQQASTVRSDLTLSPSHAGRRDVPASPHLLLSADVASHPNVSMYRESLPVSTSVAVEERSAFDARDAPPTSVSRHVSEATKIAPAERSMRLTCAFDNFTRALSAVRDTAFYSPRSACFLSAQGEELTVFAYWGHFSLLFDIPARIEQAGMISVPMRKALLLLTQMQKAARGAQRSGQGRQPARIIHLAVEERIYRNRRIHLSL